MGAGEAMGDQPLVLNMDADVNPEAYTSLIADLSTNTLFDTAKLRE